MATTDSGMEYKLSLGDSIYSTTCPAGKIKTFNRLFLDASGYTPEELIGQTHAIMRHPDVPEAVYEDLWETVVAGRPWSGVLKNKRKDGGYFWVDTNITPIIEDGFISGYASIRYQATTEQIKKAEKIYADIRNNKISLPSTLHRLSNVSTINDRANLNFYLGTVVLSGITIWIAYYFQYYFIDVAMGASIIGLYYLNKIRGLVLANEDNTLGKILVALAEGKYRARLNVKSKWLPYLELIRIRSAYQYASTIDFEYSKMVNSALMDTMIGPVVITDSQFKIIDYNISAANNLIDNECDIRYECPEELPEDKYDDFCLKSLLDVSIKKLLTKRDLEMLKKRNSHSFDAVINGKKFKSLVKPIKVHSELKSFVFVFYPEYMESDILKSTGRKPKGEDEDDV